MSWLGKQCFVLVDAHNKRFDWFVMVCITLNTIVMAMSFFGMDEEYELALFYSNYGFAFIFTVEAAIKLLGMKMNYFVENWNRFDFTIVIGTFAGYVVLWSTGAGTAAVVTVIRSFRVGRVLRLIQGAKGLNRLINTMILTLPGESGAPLRIVGQAKSPIQPHDQTNPY